MKRRGRKRKCRVQREANGQVQRLTVAERTEDVMRVAREAPHRHLVLRTERNGDLVLADPDNRKLETELGRLYLLRKIDHTQYRAGQRWHGIVNRMRRAIDAPSPHARGIMGVVLGGATGPSRDMDRDATDEALAQCADAASALRHGAGRSHRAVKRMLDLVILADHACFDLPALRLGLNILVGHFELERTPLDKSAKSINVGNARYETAPAR